jgi:hypothetical protein
VTGKAALEQVAAHLEACDDIIYRDAHQRQEIADFTYTEDETKLSEILDEARGQVHKMHQALGT